MRPVQWEPPIELSRKRANDRETDSESETVCLFATAPARSCSMKRSSRNWRVCIEQGARTAADCPRPVGAGDHSASVYGCLR